MAGALTVVHMWNKFPGGSICEKKFLNQAKLKKLHLARHVQPSVIRVQAVHPDQG
jgi:hypothetical protein